RRSGRHPRRGRKRRHAIRRDDHPTMVVRRHTRVVPTFAASDEALVAVSIDRVAEAGVGTASRSALWILDETKTKYVLFADVRGEGNWHYNRKIGEDGNVTTDGGTAIIVFNDPSFDAGGIHHMKILADGQTVKLYLD